MKNETPKNKPDYSYLGAKRQLEGMGCPLYVVGILDRKNNRMEHEELTAQQILSNMAELKKLNAWGRDIYIKPAPDHQGNNTGLILIDDLMLGTLNRMDEDGLNPAAIIETSPHNRQAWVRFSHEPIPREIATAAARIIAAKYDGDPGAAQDRQLGRLAGFTNRKPIYQTPIFVKAERCNGLVAVRGQEILEQAAEMVRQEQEAKARAAKLEQSDQPRTGKQSPSECYVELYMKKQAWLTQQGMGTDRSRLDWMIASDMLKFRYTVDEVAAAILENSIKSSERTNPEAYARTTAEKAAQHIQQNRSSAPKLRPRP